MKIKNIIEIIFVIIRELVKLTSSLRTECGEAPAQTIEAIAYYLLLFIFALDVTGIVISTYIIYLML